MFKVKNGNTRTRCELCLKLTIKTPEGRCWLRSGVFIVNFKHISYLILVFLLFTLRFSCEKAPSQMSDRVLSMPIHPPCFFRKKVFKNLTGLKRSWNNISLNSLPS